MLIFFILQTYGKIIVDDLPVKNELYAIGDPSLLLVSVEHPNMALTVFDYEDPSEMHLSLAISDLSLDNFKYQVFHSYYENLNKFFWLELGIDKNVRTRLEGPYLEAMRNLPDEEISPINARRVKGTKYFTIENEGECLTVEPTKSQFRDGYPLKLKKCKFNDKSQRFAFVSKMRAVCLLEIPNICPDSMKDLDFAEKVLKRRLDHFAL